MPRRSKGARLQLKAARRDASGNITHQATWIIRDNGRDVSTGCAADEIAAAEAKLRDYIAAKYTPKRRVRHIDDIPLADVLSIYLDAQLDKLHGRFNVDSESEDTIPAIRKFKKRIERLTGGAQKCLAKSAARRVAPTPRNAATRAALAGIWKISVPLWVIMQPKDIIAKSSRFRSLKRANHATSG
jgi:hypothetical protein